MNDYFNNNSSLSTSQLFDNVETGFDKLPTPPELQQNRWFFVTAGGDPDEITATVPYDLPSYVTGLGIRIRISATNTDAVTLSLNGLDPIPVCAANGEVLVGGALVYTEVYDLVYDGIIFRLLGDTVPANILENRWYYVTARGDPDEISATFPYLLTSYVEGLGVRLKIDVDNTGPVTLALDALDPIDVRGADGSALAAGTLIAGQVYDLVYDGAVFRMLTSPLIADAVLDALLTVDGIGSGLNADLVHDVDPSAYGLSQFAAADDAQGRDLLSLGAIVTAGDYLGIDEATPSYKIHASAGATPADTTIAFGSVPTLYLPDQSSTNYVGSIAVGNGLRSLSHTNVDTGQGNTAVGIGAGQSLTTGRLNTISGYLSGRDMTALTVNNTYGGTNGNAGCTFYGAYTGVVANGAYDCTLVGTQCGLNLTTGMDLCGFGINTLQNIEAGGETAAFGHAALQYIVGSGTFESGTGHRLSAFGDMAGRFLNPDGGGNQANKTGGKSSVYVGARTTSASNTAINENVFGYEARGKGSNTVVIGSSSVTDTYVAGKLYTIGHQTTSSGRPNAYIDPTTGEIKRSTLPADTGWVSYSPVITLQAGGPPTYTSDTEVRVIDGDCSWEGTFTMSNLNGGSGAIKIVLPYAPKRSGGCAVFLGPNGGYALGQMTWVAGSTNAIVIAYNGGSAPSTVSHCFRAQYLVQ